MSVIESIKKNVFEDRKALHLIPEPGFKEVETTNYLKSVLNELGITYESVGGTGIVAYLKGTSPTKTIAFRTDMDGLSVTEESSYEEHSIHKGFMHACGHDGHMAMMLGLARFLTHQKVTLLDNVVMIFQPAEEGPGGADVIIKEGILKKYCVDEIYGIHVFPEITQGRIGIKSGPMMAMTGEFDIEVIAKSAHGAMPHTGTDGVVIASEIVLGLQTIVSRNISPISPAVLTIGRLESGERRNIIAGRAKLEGTIRAFDKAIYNKVKERMKRYVEGVALSYDVTIDLRFVDMYPPVVNDDRLYQAFVAHHSEFCDIIEPQMISEDFSYYQEEVPGLFYFIGTYNEKKSFIYPLHNSKFNFDDEIMINGMDTYINILLYKGSIKL